MVIVRGFTHIEEVLNMEHGKDWLPKSHDRRKSYHEANVPQGRILSKAISRQVKAIGRQLDNAPFARFGGTNGYYNK